jgi:hypothetical protein
MYGYGKYTIIIILLLLFLREFRRRANVRKLDGKKKEIQGQNK